MRARAEYLVLLLIACGTVFAQDVLPRAPRIGAAAQTTGANSSNTGASGIAQRNSRTKAAVATTAIATPPYAATRGRARSATAQRAGE